MTTHTYLLPCDPRAVGRQPRVAESRYTLRFPLDTGDLLVVHMGERGLRELVNLLLDHLTAEAEMQTEIEETPAPQ